MSLPKLTCRISRLCWNLISNPVHSVLWKKAYLRQQAPAEIDGQQRSPEQMFAEIRRLQKENEYLKRQREILKKAMSILGEEPNPGMR